MRNELLSCESEVTIFLATRLLNNSANVTVLAEPPTPQADRLSPPEKIPDHSKSAAGPRTPL